MKLELSLYALKLPNVAGVFKGSSDPFAVITLLATTQDAQPKVLGRTEVLENNLNPRWVQVFTLDHELGKPLKIAVNIFDEIRKGEHKSMGSAVFDADEVLGSRGNTKAKKLKNGGSIFACIRKSAGCGLLRLQMKGSKLKNVEGLFSKSDPFFELSRKVDNAGGLTWDNVYRGKEIPNTQDPSWDTAVVELSVLCGGDLDQPILIEVYDYESSGKHKLIGKTEMSVNGLKHAATSKSPVTITNKNKDAGSLIIQQCEVEGIPSASVPQNNPTQIITAGMATTSISSVPSVPLRPSRTSDEDLFVDYVSGGCELNVVVAIDFTGSNGDPRKPGTLHYLGSPERNDYQKAIAAIVSVLSKYDSDQKYPVYGFGAKYNGIVKHCFPCGPAEEAKGVHGILDAYRHVFQTGLIMSSPTLFGEVIDTAAARARQSLQQLRGIGKQSYTILLIVTDGAVSDENETLKCLDRALDAPLSIVIVGVGNADFTSMRFLDDFSSSRGKRDIVQFVEFNKHRHDSVSLTAETLREIPRQLSSYFKSRGIGPLPPIQRSDSLFNVTAEDEVDEDEVDLSLDINETEVVVTAGGRGRVDGFNS